MIWGFQCRSCGNFTAKDIGFFCKANFTGNGVGISLLRMWEFHCLFHEDVIAKVAGTSLSTLLWFSLIWLWRIPLQMIWNFTVEGILTDELMANNPPTAWGMAGLIYLHYYQMLANARCEMSVLKPTLYNPLVCVGLWCAFVSRSKLPHPFRIIRIEFFPVYYKTESWLHIQRMLQNQNRIYYQEGNTERL